MEGWVIAGVDQLVEQVDRDRHVGTGPAIAARSVQLVGDDLGPVGALDLTTLDTNRPRGVLAMWTTRSRAAAASSMVASIGRRSGACMA